MPRRPDRSAALDQYRRRATHYDQELLLFEPLRVDAIAALRLAPGATVLDIGCGTGLSFEPLRRGVGTSGHIVGVEQSREMLAQAREQSADLLVMGGYGHSRLREMLIGGTTRHILERTTVPVLLAH